MDDCPLNEQVLAIPFRMHRIDVANYISHHHVSRKAHACVELPWLALSYFAQKRQTVNRVMRELLWKQWSAGGELVKATTTACSATARRLVMMIEQTAAEKQLQQS